MVCGGFWEKLVMSDLVMELTRESNGGGRELYAVAVNVGSEVVEDADVSGGGSFSLLAA